MLFAFPTYYKGSHFLRYTPGVTTSRGIQFIHSEIQPYNSNAQISIDLIPRYNEHTDMILY